MRKSDFLLSIQRSKALEESGIPLRINKSQLVKCKNCNKEFKKLYNQIVKYPNHFCSTNCSTIYNNKLRLPMSEEQKEKTKQTLKNKEYLKICKNCNKKFITNSSIYEYCSNECNPKKVKICIICKKEFIIYVDRKTCSDKCLLEANKKAGLKSQKSQPKRSNGEILFYDLCVKYFKNDKILSNEQIFKDKNNNYWDADVILPKYNIAICYNGLYHYEQVGKKHNLKQVQSRDRIKSKIIFENNYIEYIVKDLGKFNKDFVYKEFHKFIFNMFILFELTSKFDKF